MLKVECAFLVSPIYSLGQISVLKVKILYLVKFKLTLGRYHTVFNCPLI